MNEVAGNIRVKVCETARLCNSWLSVNPDTEVIDIKFSPSVGYQAILIVYRVTE